MNMRDFKVVVVLENRIVKSGAMDSYKQVVRYINECVEIHNNIQHIEVIQRVYDSNMLIIEENKQFLYEW